jgi:hypothetical protein
MASCHASCTSDLYLLLEVQRQHSYVGYLSYPPAHIANLRPFQYISALTVATPLSVFGELCTRRMAGQVLIQGLRHLRLQAYLPGSLMAMQDEKAEHR